MRSNSADSYQDDRAQTVIGFVIAVSTFVLIIAVLFASLGGVLTTPITNQADTTEEAAQTTQTLVEDTLSAHTTSSPTTTRLSHEKVVEFFDNDSSQLDNVTAGDNLSSRVTLVYIGPQEPPTAFGSNRTLVVGDQPPNSNVASSYTTTAVLDDRPVMVEVETWN